MSKEQRIHFAFPDTDCDLTSLTIDDEYDYVVCFAFNVTSDTSSYIANMRGYLEMGESQSADASDYFNQPDTTKLRQRNFLILLKLILIQKLQLLL